jgi:hypothetical protein
MRVRQWCGFSWDRISLKLAGGWSYPIDLSALKHFWATQALIPPSVSYPLSMVSSQARKLIFTRKILLLVVHQTFTQLVTSGLGVSKQHLSVGVVEERVGYLGIT